MLHDSRIWCVNEVESAEALAEQITSTTWCCCTAFQVRGRPDYVWLNDSTSADAIQEYAVCRVYDSGEIKQIESITFGWCDSNDALNYIVNTLNGEDDHSFMAHKVTPTLQTLKDHPRCPHCA